MKMNTITTMALLPLLLLQATARPAPALPLATTYYADTDGDGYGDPDSTSTVEGPPPAGYVGNNIDCDDTNPQVYPGAPELINGVDDDCNGVVDDAAACSLTTTWNGTTWQPFQPVPEQAAVVDGDLNITSDFAVCTLTVNDGADVTVTDADLTVSFGLIVSSGGSLSLDADSVLLQELVATENLNSGDVSIGRAAPMWRQDYTYWGAPVAGQNLRAFSAATLQNRFYVLDEATNTFDAVFVPGGFFEAPGAYDFEPGRGYMVRAPDTFPDPGLPENRPAFTGWFTGTPNNGSIQFDVAPLAAYSMISNPYPSVLDADDFLASNIGTLYFWTHHSQEAGADNYASYNGTGAASGNGIVPNGKIASGQGFLFDNADDAPEVTFTNQMRDGANGAQFFRSVERSRIWINLAQDGIPVNQMLLGYLPSATLGVDGKYDGKSMPGGSGISTLIDGGRYVIQGRQAFTETDVVALSLRILTAGVYTISIDHVDGLFDGGQAIYLRDNTAGVIHGLTQGAYGLATQAGDFDERFELLYLDTTLGVDTAPEADVLTLYSDHGTLFADSGAHDMSEIRIFDIRGRLLYSKSGTAARRLELTGLEPAGQVLLVRVTVEGRVLTKKVVY